MAFLRLNLLGAPRIERDGQYLHFARRHALALGIYLAVTGYTHSRDALTTLFWPQAEPSTGRANLRRTLHVLGRTVGYDFVAVEDGHVRFSHDGNLWMDLEQFRTLVAACHQHGHPADEVCNECLPLLTQAVDLYRDDFLAGFTLPDSPDFDRWQFFQGEQLRSEMALVLDLLVRSYSERDQYMQAIVYAQRRLALDPLDEPTHRRLMQLYAWTEQPAAAHRQYDLCSRLLAAELAVAPAPETTALHQAIVSRQVTPPQPAITTRIPAVTPVQDDIRLISVVSVGLADDLDQDEVDLAAHIESMENLAALVEEAARPFGGHVEYVVGEDILAIFGHDHVHEDDAERAVRTALAVHQAVHSQNLPIRIGINTGMAYCGHSSGPSARSTVMGPVINLATRLRDSASIGQTLVGRHTYLPTRGLCDYLPTVLTLPGVASPVSAYAVVRLRARTEKARGVEGLRAELVGRSEEMTKLKTALRRVQTGIGSVVTLAGVAGVGKSRLVAELKQSAFIAPSPSPVTPASADTSILWLEGRGLEHAMQTSYWLFVDLLRGYFGNHEGDNGTAMAQRVIATLYDLKQRGHLTSTEVDEIGSLLGRLLALHFGNPWDQHLQTIAADQMHRRMQLALQRFLATLAQICPLVLVLEDLHWADPHSLELLSALVESVSTVPILLLSLYRPEQAQAEEPLAAMARQTCPRHYIAIHLQDLTPGESRQLVASLLAIEQLPDDLRQLMLDKSQGNPFFLEEWVRALIDAGVLYREGETWQARHAITALAIPESVQSVILSRVDRLGSIPRRALQMAAVLGRIFRPRVLEAMAGVDLDLAALSQLEKQSFIYVERSVPEVEYSFHHALVQDAIYKNLPNPRRMDLHRRAGQALEMVYADNLEPYVEDLARHYDQGDLADKAILYLLRAGKKAQQTTLNREALDYFSRALARIEGSAPDRVDPQQHLDALRGMGESYAGLGDLVHGEPYLRQAISQAARMDLLPAEQARLYIPLCHLMRWGGRFEDLFHLSRTGLELLEDDLESAEAVVLVAFVATGAYLTGRRHQYRPLIQQVIPVLRRLPYGQHLFSAYGVASWWYRDRKRVPEALAWVETLAAEAQRRNDLWTLGYLRSWPGYWLQEAVGDLKTILANLQEALSIAEQIGDQILRGYALTFLGLVHWGVGNLEAAESTQQEALTIHGRGQALHMQVLNHKALGLVHLSRGEWTQAIEHFEAGLGKAEQIQYRVHGVRMSLMGLARAYLMLGRGEEAIPLYYKVAVEDEADADGQIWIACALAGLAEVLDDPSQLREIYRSLQAARSPADPLPLRQRQMEAATPNPRYSQCEAVDFPADPDASGGWRWIDPYGDCAFAVDRAGLTLYGANFYRDLWFNNKSAPRFLCAVEGEFAVQAICTTGAPDRPAMGGIVLWQGEQNYLRLGWGAHGAEEISLLGCLDNRDLYLGRGRLPGATAVHLRLEREEGDVLALCSADGERWFRIARVPFPADGPVQIGPFATAMQFSWVYPGIAQQGTAIHFSSFRICRSGRGRSFRAVK